MAACERTFIDVYSVISSDISVSIILDKDDVRFSEDILKLLIVCSNLLEYAHSYDLSALAILRALSTVDIATPAEIPVITLIVSVPSVYVLSAGISSLIT